ncbi:hypothetical protein HCA81_08295 [Listeria booriae]|uniref:membrane lipoprotein lipid attachment site-containing protein n=1 Tax=Listeria booriae TaxID=1552123 RepID=UPI0016265F25|nr:membrane lipoprotein lipid attachment site-containing protein [Listeria booriae]MBC2021047.1 hypothetical protein [Listeria booriae]
MKKLILGLFAALVLVGCSNENSKAEPANEPKAKKKVVQEDGHDYQYDVVTSATTSTFGTKPDAKLTPEQKEKQMFWSVQPPIGVVKGHYYKNESLFDGGNKGILELVTDDDGKLIHVEFNEFASENYYESKYANASKRLSDYAFFQATNTRTDDTLVTWVNGITFLEGQMLQENRLDGNFETVKGSSNSARNGMMPLAAAMKDWVKKPFGFYYYGIAEPLGNGSTARLQVVTKDGKMTQVAYDEIFADRKTDITDTSLQNFYRQSKYYSLDYERETGDHFVETVDKITNQALKSQDLLRVEKQDSETYTNYMRLAEKLQTEMK